MKKLLLLTAIFLQFTFRGNAQTPVADLHQVKVGMSREEVTRLVGKPVKSYFNPINNNNRKDSVIWDVYAVKTVLYITNKVKQVQNSAGTIMTTRNNDTYIKQMDTSGSIPMQKQFIKKTPAK